MVMFKRPLWVVACFYLVCLTLIGLIKPSLLLATQLEVLGEKESDVERNLLEGSVVVEGLVTAYTSKDENTGFTLTHVRLLMNDEGGYQSLSNIKVTCKDSTYDSRMPGSRVRLKGRLNTIKSPTNPGQFDYRTYQAIRSVAYTMTDPVLLGEPDRSGLRSLLSLPERLRALLRQRICSVYPEESTGLVASLMIGDRSLMSWEDSSLWRRSGIAHMLAISGMHLTLVGMGLFRFLRRRGMGMPWSIGLSCGALCFYTCLVGAPISALRALIMFLYNMGGRLLGEDPDTYNSLAIAFLLIMMGDPAYILDAGFQLSFCAVVTLSFFAGRGPIQGALMMYLVPVPLILYHYGELPLLGIFFNLLLVPLLPVAFCMAAIGTAFGGMAAYPAVFIFRIYEWLIEFFNTRIRLTAILGRPKWYQILIYYLLLAGVIFVFKKWQRKLRRYSLVLVLPLLLMVFYHFPPKGLEVTMLDVGQGDCCVIQMPNGITLLSDGGSSSVKAVGTNRIQPYLIMEGIRSLDFVMVSHFDEDHVSGISELLENVADHRTSLRIGTLILPYRQEMSHAMKEMLDLAERAQVKVKVLSAEDEILFRGRRGIDELTKIHVLSPASGDLYDNENDASLVWLLSYGDFDMLFTGDLEEEKTLMSRYRSYRSEDYGSEDYGTGDYGPEDYRLEDNQSEETEVRLPAIEVLKAGHHGSRYSSSTSFLQALQPRVTLISVGYHNRYGHPHDQTLQRLENIGSHVYRTDWNGAIRIKTDGKSYQAATYRGGEWA
ncbi:MAG: ComEC/Rec2 family competence protein [Lachnospiraceae bacterium]|nr:ComEC/Rec2 family competence protein [Candidatus Equihabitans merdae]